ncbi:lytic transglycosylase domain-containing protein [Altericroceibacterium xinjiangense]|uniref:lytic transglycosylase domain-containing protein n=1 Tax=Altericroceibacterium xinjiangense TaxID=762261 RepID=UPI000F7F0E80|nr:lytic transglycosylase domain-containing protein [Altericroceibacterium xinjiangense]
MILAVTRQAAAIALAACLCAPAQADVLEVGAGAARWVSGPLTHESAPAEAAWTDIPVPEEAIVDPGLSGSRVPAAYAARVTELAARYDLSPALIEALVWQESRWRADAVSPVGARGLAQLMPGTARELGVDPNDPFANLEGGARYLRAQIDRFGGDLEKALAAYNAGPARVMRAGGIPRIRETQIYVASVLGRLTNHTRKD